MIQLENVNKYYNKRKSNKIHVINDITLELPNKGLVVLFGPSGSGKTTLLNVISGLDKIDNGTITFDDKILKKYKANTWDKIRNRYIGYVFQNYNLLDNLSVYDNIALTLHMIGVTDKTEITNRIEYILEKVGLKNFKKRKTNQLSGGQQQRVAIARALAKNPEVIIADEPTGNLDNKNTIAIMQIIQRISEERLVILVTHDSNIAKHYATQIIELEDGRIISNQQNDGQGNLHLKNTTDIYTKDLTEYINTSNNQNNVKVFSEHEINPSLDINLILRNGTLYVDVKDGHYNKVQLLDSTSEVKVYDGSFEDVIMNDSNEPFHLESVMDETYTPKKKSIISFKEAIILSYRRFIKTYKKRRAIYIGFALSAILLAFAVSMLSSVYNMDESNYLTHHKDALLIHLDELTYEDLEQLELHESIHSIQLYHPTSLSVNTPFIFQADSLALSLKGTALPLDLVNEETLVMGRLPQSEYEIVINKQLAEEIIDDYAFINVGIESLKDLLYTSYSFSLKSSTNDYEGLLHIVGIVDDSNPVMYMDENVITMLATKIAPYELFDDQVVIIEGDLPITPIEFMLIEDPENTDPLEFMTFTFEYEEVIHPITGIYNSEEVVPSILSATDLLREAYFEKYYTRPSDEIILIAQDKEEAIAFLLSQEIDATSIYDTEYEAYRETRLSESVGTITFTIIVLIASSVSYYFILKSAMISRIYEVSVYRSLGVLKKDIYKIFLVDVLIITTCTSLVGYFLAIGVLTQIEGVDISFSDLIYVRFESVMVGILLLYIANVISGLLPLVGLLRNTPAQITSKFDL